MGKFASLNIFSKRLPQFQVADLKRELKIRGLNVTGNKTELAERLQSALLGKISSKTTETHIFSCFHFSDAEGDVFDDTVISEELLDDNDDVLNVKPLK